jgi:RNA polymerase sigma factor (sigma-70 family)
MLAKRWTEHQDTDAAAKLVNSHLRLVAKIAMGYRGYGLPVSELISEGNIGLMQGVKKFEPERGFRLATYAMWWIRASIQEFILRSWSLVKMGTTAAQKKLFFNLRRMKNQIEAFEDGDMKPEDVAKIATDLGVTEEEVISMNRAWRWAGILRSTCRCARKAKASGRIGWSTPIRCRTSASPRRGDQVRHRAARQAMERSTTARSTSSPSAPDRRSQDAGGAQPGLRRQPRAHPPDRGAGVREASEGADEPRRASGGSCFRAEGYRRNRPANQRAWRSADGVSRQSAEGSAGGSAGPPRFFLFIVVSILWVLLYTVVPPPDHLHHAGRRDERASIEKSGCRSPRSTTT